MTDPETSPTQDVDELAVRVDDLLDQMQSACEEVAARFSDDEDVDGDLAALLAEAEQGADDKPDPTDTEAAAASQATTAEAQPEAQPEADPEPDAAAQQQDDQREQAPSGDPPPTAAAADTAASEAADLDDDLGDDLGDELEALLHEAEHADDPPAANITELDEQLAERTEALLDDDADVPTSQPAAPEPSQPETTKPAAQPASTQATDPTDSTPTDGEPAQPTPPAQSTDTQPTPATTTTGTAEPKTPAPSRPLPDGKLAPVLAAAHALGGWTARTTKLAARHAEPLARKTATALAKPLDAHPPVVKQTVGWIALWTLFLAACVWITIAMFRTAPTPTPTADPATLTDPLTDTQAGDPG